MSDTEEHSQPPASLSAVLTGDDFSTSKVESQSDKLGKKMDTIEEAADRALRKRPTLSIRTRLLLAFSLVFLFNLVTSLWTFQTLSNVQDRIVFLEIADDYTNEIQQARRFEKNYLLYGTNLSEALEHTEDAQQITRANFEKIQKVMGAAAVVTVNNHLADYRRLLLELGTATEPEARSAHEADLRRHGAEMYDFAQSFVAAERAKLNATFSLARNVTFLFLAALCVLIVLVTNFLARRITSTLARFMDYTTRIGHGDFTPITPVRRYRDEFSQLALAINRMVNELDRRHQILVESHKLRALGTLVAGVAHELNNPLNNIMLTAGVFKEEYEDLTDDEKMEMVDELITQTDRSRKIVRNLLDFARESETKLEALDLSQIVAETIRLVGNQVKVKKVRLTTAFPDDVPPVHGDRQLLSEVFMNLIINALDVVPEKSEIRIRVDDEREDGFVAVDVSDDGPGIPEHVMARIFDPFFTTKPKGKGTGLGLSVARGIVQKLGGDLRVSSKLGAGATFTVLLPVTGIPSALSSKGGGWKQDGVEQARRV